MKLKEIRNLTNKTQEEVAKDLNLQKQTYQNYELAKREPDIKTLIKIADYFDVSLDYLCDRQWNNQIGYIPNEKKEVVKLILQLNQTNTIKVFGFVSGLLAGQN